MLKTVQLRDARLARRPPVTQDQLAALAGVGQSYISNLENGTRRPSRDMRAKLARALRVAVDRLVVPADVEAR